MSIKCDDFWEINKKAVLLQGTTARCTALVQKACTYFGGNAVNRKNTKTIGEHMEVVEKTTLQVYQ